MSAPRATYLPPVELRTARLRLREPKPVDVQALFDVYASDSRATLYLFLEAQTDVSAFGEIVEQLRTMREAGRGAAWVLELNESSRPVGMVSVVNGAHGLELAYALGYDYWNRGLASEALRAVVEDAIAQPGVFRVWAYHAVDNPASGCVLEKAGLHHEALLRRWSVFPNLSPDPSDVVSSAGHGLSHSPARR